MCSVSLPECSSLTPGDHPVNPKNEVFMFAYLLLLAAVLTRVLPHAGWMNFTAVGGALLFFGARRSWRGVLLSLGGLMAGAFFLTAFSYHHPLRWEGYR